MFIQSNSFSVLFFHGVMLYNTDKNNMSKVFLIAKYFGPIPLTSPTKPAIGDRLTSTWTLSSILTFLYNYLNGSGRETSLEYTSQVNSFAGRARGLISPEPAE